MSQRKAGRERIVKAKGLNYYYMFHHSFFFCTSFFSIIFKLTIFPFHFAFLTAPHNFKCKFPNWMTKKKQWHTLDYSYSYTFWQNNNTLSIANTTSLMDENYYLNEKLTRHSLFNGDEIRINCVDTIKSTNDYVQLLTHYLTEW